MRVESLTPEVEARPGTDTSCRVRVRNDQQRAATYSVLVHGLAGRTVPVEVPAAPVVPGGVLDVEVALAVPIDTAAGSHAVAVELRSDHVGELPAVVDVTVVVSSLDQVVVRINPDVLKGRGRTGFAVELVNRRRNATSIELSGFGRDLDVTLDRTSVHLEPGDEARVKGTVKGPRHVQGHPRRHVLTVAARSSSSPVFATASFQQRSLLPVRLRAGAAMLVAVLVWALIAGAGVLWFTREDTAPDQAGAPVTTDEDGSLSSLAPPDTGPDASSPDGSGDGGTGTNGSAGSGDGGSGTGGGSGAGAGGGSGSSEVTGVISGTIATPNPSDSVGVRLTLTELSPADTDTGGGAVALVGSGPGRSVEVTDEATGPTKYWPALYGTYNRETVTLPETTSIDPVVVGSDSGEFAFPPVPVAKSYRLTASQPGFDTQAFVVRANADGSPLELEISLQPSDATIAGRVLGPDGAGLGGVELSISDGELVFDATSSTDPDDVGAFRVAGLSTPGVYTVVATRAGLATSVRQIALGNGESDESVTISMERGVGTIIGRVTNRAGDPLGGISVTVTSGEFSRTATTATEGRPGLYQVPALPLGKSYVVAVAAPGYLPEAKSVELARGTINATEDFVLTASTGSVIGRVRSVDGDTTSWLANASVTLIGKDVTSQTLTDTGESTGTRPFFVRRISATAGDPGAFTVDDLPPGEYLANFAHYQHESFSRVITVKAGKTRDLGVVDLRFDPAASDIRYGSLAVDVFEVTEGGGRQPLAEWSVSYDNTISDEPPYTGTFPLGSEVTTESATLRVPVGTYDLTFSRRNYRNQTIEGVTVGIGTTSIEVVMLKLGAVNGYVYDASNPPVEPATIDAYSRLKGYRVQIVKDGESTPRQELTVDETSTSALFQSFSNVAEGQGLTVGQYQLRINGADNPTGFYVDPDQELRQFEDGAPPVPLGIDRMRFEIPEDSDAPVGPVLVKAYPYPELTVTIQLLRDSSSRPDPDVTVSLSCDGATTQLPDTTFTAATSGVSVSFDSRAMDPLFDGRSSVGNCTLTATPSTGYVGTESDSFPFEVDLDGGTDNDRDITLWLVQDDLLGGSTSWIDPAGPTVETLADATGTISRGPAIIGFRTAANGSQVEVRDTGVSRSLATGGWTFAAGATQVWGRTTYTVAGATMATGTFDIVIDDTGTRIDNVSPTLDVAFVAKNQIAITTLEPTVVGLSGSVSVVSTTPDIGLLDPEATLGAFTGTVDLRDGADPARIRTYTVTGCPAPRTCTDGVAPGTWTVSVDTPAGHRLLPTADPAAVVTGGTYTRTARLEPAAADFGVEALTFVELAQVDLTVVEPDRATGTTPTNPAWGAGKAPTVVVEAVTPTAALLGDLPAAPGYEVSETDGTASITDLAVDPTGAPATYRLQIADDADHRFDEAIVTVGSTVVPVVGGWVQFTVQPGEQVDVEIEFHRLGTLSGSALGYVNDVSRALDPSTLDVTYQRVVAGVLQGTAQTPEFVGADFVIRARAGCYLVLLDPDGYETDPPRSVPTDADCPTVDIDDGAGGTRPVQTYRLSPRADSDLASPFEFDALRTELVFQVNEGPGEPPVVSAEIEVVYLGAGVAASTSTTTDGNGAASTGAVVWPGLTEVTIIATDINGAMTHFPVTFRIDVPVGATSRTITADAVPIGGAIDAAQQVKAVNDSGDPIDMPPGEDSTDRIVVTRVFSGGPDVIVSDGTTSSTIDNTSTESSLDYVVQRDATVTDDAGAPATSGSFDFANLPRGTHVLTFPVMPGYSPDAPFERSVTIGLTGTAALDADVVYEAKNVTVKVRVMSDKGTAGDLTDDVPLTGATVTLAPRGASGVGWGTPVAMSGGPGGIYTLTGVEPRLSDYLLEVSAPRFGDQSTQVRIRPQADLEQTLDDVVVSRTSLEIGGSLVRLDSTGGSVAEPPSNTTVTVTNIATGDVETAVVDQLGRSWRAVVGEGDFRISAQAAGYRPATRDVTVTRKQVADDTPPTIAQLRLDRALAFTWLVTDGNSGGINGATVRIGSRTTTTTGGSASIITFAGDSMAWSVTRATDGWGPQSGTAVATEPTIDVVMLPTIRGGVARVNGTATAGLTVRACPSSVTPALCNDSTPGVVRGTSGADGSYALRAAPGNWTLVAVDALGNRGSAAITVLDGTGAALAGSMATAGTSTVITAAPDLRIVTAPTGVTFTPGSKETEGTLTWTVAAGLRTQIRCTTSASVPSSSDCEIPTTTAFQDLPDGTVSYTYDDLVPGTSYTFEVRALNPVDSTFSAVTSLTASSAAIPAPAGLTVTGVTHNRISVSWTEVVGYTYVACIRPAAIPTCTGTSQTTPVTFNGLSPSTSYAIDVRAVVSATSGTYQSAAATVLQVTAPAPP